VDSQQLNCFQQITKKNAVDYDGDRSLESLVEFIEQNASIPLPEGDDDGIAPEKAKDEL